MIGDKTINSPIEDSRMLPSRKKTIEHEALIDMPSPSPAKKDPKQPTIIEEFLNVSTVVQCILTNPQNYLLMWNVTAKEQ
jgi:hypothetical protein